MDTPPAAVPDPSQALFAGLPVPTCLLDRDGRLLAMNPRAEAFWGVSLEAVGGRPALAALGVVPSDGGSLDAWRRLSAPAAPPRLSCRVSTADGQVRPVSIVYVPLEGLPGDQQGPGSVLFVIEPGMAAMLADMPQWALRDPVTGLGNRASWEHESVRWLGREGCVVFFDLDDLKETNDLHGHLAGDRILAAVGKALGSLTPAGGVTIRYGGDEFVTLLPQADPKEADAWAQRAVRRVATGATGELPLLPRLSYGVAAFAPGGVHRALRQADEALYVRKGVLLVAASGGRFILTRAGRAAIRGPGDADPAGRPGAFGASFGAEFDAYFRHVYANAITQARGFVAFVAPEPGAAVVEVGAGAGRITVDGGLARAVGPSGQLLVTDPAPVQLAAVRRRAAEAGLHWVRFLQAPAEELPLASHTVDLVLGSTFLHFTDAPRALAEMARILRPGGRLALNAFLETPWPRLWREALAPVHEELQRRGLPLRHPLLPAAALRRLVQDAGLRLERERILGPDRMDFPNVEIALASWRQIALVRLILREVPAARCAELEAAFEARVRTLFPQSTPEERALSAQWIELVARKDPAPVP
jgi:diguanylate cyclase (GGDEF)-like protein